MRSPSDYRDTYLRHLRNLRNAFERIDRGDIDASSIIAPIISQLVHDKRPNIPVLGNLSAAGLSAGMQSRFLSTAQTSRPQDIGAALLVRSNGLASKEIISGSVIWYGAQYSSAPDFSRKPRQLRTEVKWISFDEWWNETVIIMPMADWSGIRALFTRRDIVLTVRDKDEGSHTDPILPPDYLELSRGNGLGFGVKPGPVLSSDINAIFGSAELRIVGGKRGETEQIDDGLIRIVKRDVKSGESMADDFVEAAGLVVATLRQIGHELMLSLLAADIEVCEELRYEFPDYQSPPNVGSVAIAASPLPPQRWQCAKDWIRNFSN